MTRIWPSSMTGTVPSMPRVVRGSPPPLHFSAESQQGGSVSACGSDAAGGAAQQAVAAACVDALDRASASDPGTTGSRQPDQEELHTSPAPIPHRSPPPEPCAEPSRPPATTGPVQGESLEGGGSADAGEAPIVLRLRRQLQLTRSMLDTVEQSLDQALGERLPALHARLDTLERQVAERDATIAQIRRVLGGTP